MKSYAHVEAKINVESLARDFARCLAFGLYYDRDAAQVAEVFRSLGDYGASEGAAFANGVLQQFVKAFASECKNYDANDGIDGGAYSTPTTLRELDDKLANEIATAQRYEY